MLSILHLKTLKINIEEQFSLTNFFFNYTDTGTVKR